MDLNQGNMLQVTAKVTLAPSELREYRRLEALGDDVKGWLFDRNVAKDAIRLVWSEMTGERLFPSDIEVEPTAGGRFTAHRRGTSGQSYPPAAVDRAGAATVAVSVAGADVLGLALAVVGSPKSDEEKSTPLDVEEERLLAAFRGEPAEASSLRLRCAAWPWPGPRDCWGPMTWRPCASGASWRGPAPCWLLSWGMAMPEGRSRGARRRPGTAT